MNTIDWKKKLTSRKFWTAVCSMVANLVIAFGGAEDTAVQITAIIMSAATVIAYIIGEGLVDAANVNTIEIPVEYEDEEPDEALEEYGPGLEG